MEFLAEDLSGKISKTVFVTNFPDHLTAQDLWNVCTAYGKVIDVYIPLKRSKSGKKFAFVRFLKVDNMKRLIENLCTIWIGRFHLHANPVRFQRESMASFVQPSKGKMNTGPVKKSFASVMKSNDHKGSPLSDSSPTIVMDDSCIVDKDLSCSLMEKMLNHEGLTSWFSELCFADPSFVSKDRLVWISIEGLPFNTWNNNAYAKIISQWGTLSEFDTNPDSSSFAKKIFVVTKVHTIINQRIKIIVKGKIYWIRVKELKAWAPEFNNEFCENSSSDEESKEDGEINSQNVDDFDHVSESSSVRGTWISSSLKLMFVSVYAPQDISERRSLWDYINHMINLWDGECIILGDFNEVRTENERFGVSLITGPFSCVNLLLNYGPTPFRVFHSWFTKDGFNNLIADTWNNLSIMETNKISLLRKKFQALKARIKNWSRDEMHKAYAVRHSAQSRILELDKLIDKGLSNNDIINERISLLKDIHDLDKRHSSDLAQKAKIQWAIEGDENSKYFHGIINKKRSQLAIRGVLVDGEWIEDPPKVKNEFLKHFSNRFSMPTGQTINLDSHMFQKISINQNADLESDVFLEEIKKAVWDKFPPGSNSSFITLIPKSVDAKMVKDFRPISLIGSFYKIVAKILSNRLCTVMPDLVSDVQTAFISKRQILDGPFILNKLISWCKYHKTKAMIFKADFEMAFDSVRWDYLDGGIRIDESLTLSHLFYADDDVFIGKWDKVNVITIVNMLKCFYLASGLKINIQKSKIMGIGTSQEEVDAAANVIGCNTFSSPFNYLGVKVGSSSSRSNFWDEVIAKLSFRLSKWKIKTLSIGVRFTLNKDVLSSLPIYLLSIYKTPVGVLRKMESIRRRFFNGADINENKISMICWEKIMASRKKGGLGISSFFAQNHALLFKWIWRFRSKDSSLWYRVIKAMYGDCGALDNTDCNKISTVEEKINASSISCSFRRQPRGSFEEEQFSKLIEDVNYVTLSIFNDRWIWSLDSSGEF
nr:RNA-directed DNA polymerase, eukaryota [Tanacetum cinerariifolium]